MGCLGKVLALVLILVMVISSSSFLMIKPVIAQNNAPSISIVYPTNGTVVNAFMGSVGIEWQYPANTTFSWVGYSLNGTNWTHGGNTTVTGKNEIGFIENNGDYTFTIFANDTAGNWATPQTVNFHVHVIGDALQENPIFPIALILTLIILFALAVLLAYRRHRKNLVKKGDRVKNHPTNRLKS